MTVLRLLAAVVTVFALTACDTAEPGPSRTTPAPSTTTASATTVPVTTGPSRAVDRLMRALNEGDCKAVKDLVVSPSEIDCGLVAEATGTFEAEGIDLDAVRYRRGSIVGDSTTVTIDWANGYPTESYDVQRVDGTWLVVFDSAA